MVQAAQAAAAAQVAAVRQQQQAAAVQVAAVRQQQAAAKQLSLFWQQQMQEVRPC
jgi:hypothetical protein